MTFPTFYCLSSSFSLPNDGMADEDGDAEVDEKDIIIVRWQRMLTERAPKVQIPGQEKDKDEDGKNVYTEKVLPPI